MTNFSKLKAGEIVLIPFPYTDMSSKKVRPVFVVRDSVDEDVLVAPISTNVNRSKNDYLIGNEDYEGAPLPVTSCLRYEKLVTLSSGLVLKKVAALKTAVTSKIQNKIADFILS
jgi:mRNA interferase MazF